MTAYHELDTVEEALVELAVLVLVLRAVSAVHHPTGAAAGRPKLLLTRVLVGGIVIKTDMRHSH